MSEVLFETAALKLERKHAGVVAIEDERWYLTVKTPDGVAVLTKAGLIRLHKVLAAERSSIVP